MSLYLAYSSDSVRLEPTAKLSVFGRPTVALHFLNQPVQVFTRTSPHAVKSLSTIATEGDRGLPHSVATGESAKAQICRTRAEPQQIVATRLLYCLQHSVLFKSSAKDSPPPIFHFNSWTSDTSLSGNATEPTRYGTQPKPILTQLTCAGPTSSFLVQILT